MTTKIEERIARLKLDNKSFEKGLLKSAKTLGNFQSKLTLLGSGMTFGSKMDKALDTVNGRFSALGVVAEGFFFTLGAQALAAGEKMVSALAIEPISQGFEEYELKINSVKTILASAKTNAGLPVTLDLVNKQLQALNKYSDDTIYSFSDMTSNIGKFTNAGVGLEDAVQAIKGIANAAALSGANSNEASRAMYNFAQALSAGYVKLIDWKSIENANMATVGFKQELIDAAVAAGTLEKTADGMYMALGASEGMTATKGFNESLTYQWMTTDVLTKTLQKYADTSTEVGKKATDAATKVRTWSQLMDTTKEAFGSGWAETFELIIGNFEDASNLFSSLASSIGAAVSVFSNSRNNILKDWRALGGRQDLIDGLVGSFKLLGKILKPIADAFKAAFPPITGKRLAEISKSFSEFVNSVKIDPKISRNVYKVFKGLFDLIWLTWKGLKVVLTGIAAIIAPLLPINFKFLDLLGGIYAIFSRLRVIATTADIFKKSIKVIKDSISNFYESLKWFFSNHKDDIKTFIDTLKGFIPEIKNFVANSITYFKSYEDDIKAFVAKIGVVVYLIQQLYIKIKDYFSRFNGVLDGAKDTFKRGSDAVKDFYDNMTKSVDSFDDSKIRDSFSNIVGWFKSFYDSFTTKLAAFKDTVKTDVDEIKTTFKPFVDFFQETFTKVKDDLSGVWRTDGVDGVMEMLGNLLKGGLLASVVALIYRISDVFKEIGDFSEGVTEVLEGVGDTLKSYQNNLRAKTLLLIGGAIAVLAVSLILLASVDPEKLKYASIAMGVLFGELTVSMATLGNAISGTKLPAIAAALVALSVSLLILVGALKTVAVMPEKDMNKAIASITTMILELVAVTKLMGRATSFAGAAASLTLMGVAIGVMTIALKALGKMDVDVLTQGLVAVAKISAGMAAFATIVSNTTSGTDLLATSASMGIMAVALGAMGGVATLLGMVNPDQLNQGLMAIGVMMGEVAAFSILVSDSINPLSFVAAAAGIVAIALSMKIIAGIISTIGSMSKDVLTKGAIGLGVAIGTMVGALLLLSNPMVAIGAASMVVMAGALAILTPIIKALGNLTWEQLGKGMLALAGVLVIFGGAAAIFGSLLTPVIPVLIVLAAVAAGIGLGFSMMGTGMLAIAAGGGAAAYVLVTFIKEVIKMMPDFATAVGQGFVNLAEAIGEGAPKIGKAVKSILESIGKTVSDELPKFIETILEFVSTLMAKLIDRVPEFTDAGMKILFGFLKGVADNIGPVVDQFLKIITRTLAAIAERLPELSKAGSDFVAAYLTGIGENLPKVIDAGFKLMINFINGIADSARENTPLVMGAIQNLVTAILDGIFTFFGITAGSSESGRGIASAVLQGIIDGIGGGLGKVVKAFTDGAHQMIEGFKELFGIHSPSTVMSGFGENIIQGLIQGMKNLIQSLLSTEKSLILRMITTISDRINDFKVKARELVSNFISGIKDKADALVSSFRSIIKPLLSVVNIDEFMSVGKNIALGIVDGVNSKIEDVKTAVRGLADAALNSIRDFLDMHSPSKAFAEVGKYSALGMVVGIQNYSGKVAEATKAMGEDSINSAKSAMGRINEALTSGLDNAPRITPVLDLNSIKSGAGAIADMLGNSSTYGIAADISSRSSAKAERIQNGGDSSTHVTIENKFDLQGLSVRNDQDIESIAEKLHQKQQASLRGRGMRILPAGI